MPVCYEVKGKLLDLSREDVKKRFDALVENETDTLCDEQYGENKDRWRPERASWTEFSVFQREDGTHYRIERNAHRWASSYSYSDWAKIDYPNGY